MAMWLMRAGRAGEREALALEHQVAVLGWEDLPDLSPCEARTDLDALMRQTYPEQKPRTLTSWQSQVWALRDTIQIGDVVVLPLKTRAAVALGTVSGGYSHRPDLPGGPFHTRPVEWAALVPRRSFDMDILLSLGAFASLCRIERHDAEQRIRALLAQATGGEHPLGAASPPPIAADLEQRLHAQICERIAARFKGHRLARLVGALLEAQGYKTRVSPPGADGGVDILAGSGPLGFDAPRLVVQVKSGDTRVDVRPLRELAGVMSRFQADHALLVGWSGFNQPVRTEAASAYFRMRLWDASDIIAAVKENYARLPADMRADIPLKQVWTLVSPEQTGVAA